MAPLDLSDFDLQRRSDAREILRQAGTCLQNPIMQAVLASLQGKALILDRNRQAVAANRSLLEELGLEGSSSIQGYRPGEILQCSHVREGLAGCGTSEACTRCGALLAILASQAEESSIARECWMTGGSGGHQAREFACRATRIRLGDDPFTVFVLQDISAEKRRDALEQIFLHDLNNALQGLQTWSEILGHPGVAHDRAIKRIQAITSRIRQEVRCQRVLLDAEQGTLTLHQEILEPVTLLQELSGFFVGHPKATGKRLHTECLSLLPLYTDRTLLMRILTNGTLNALEATPVDGEVRVSYDLEERHPTFSIHNDQPIPVQAQGRVFQRCFSTKAPRGRGLGTYSMKLLGEDYLGGRLTLSSDADSGTSFTLVLPAG